MGGTLGVFHGIVKREQAERLLSGYIFLAPAVYLIKYKLLAIFLFGFAPVIKVITIKILRGIIQQNLNYG